MFDDDAEEADKVDIARTEGDLASYIYGLQISKHGVLALPVALARSF
ncbi:hypothetical protein K3148_03080 [Qipengyuania aurantiaca]|uniref:Uncharacterized protein n=1 Tax=Qipengyuania aurantiaca TaxID=2867233 RepID=A0ABX8ZU16_9SPHN|nr:hypothetical protein [Qipengyuania aurantiaca]QZD91289.1 hypothetical protein K3148_03080 [Qipengyuania aurantiaca]